MEAELGGDRCLNSRVRRQLHSGCLVRHHPAEESQVHLSSKPMVRSWCKTQAVQLLVSMRSTVLMRESFLAARMWKKGCVECGVDSAWTGCVTCGSRRRAAAELAAPLLLLFAVEARAANFAYVHPPRVLAPPTGPPHPVTRSSAWIQASWLA